MTVEQKYKDFGVNIDYDNFNRVFEIEAIDLEKSGVFSKALVRVVLNKVRAYLGYLEPLVNSMPHSFYAMVVFKNIDESKKKKAGEVYSRLMDYYHKSLIVETKSDEEIKKFIEEVWKKWDGFEKKVMELLDDCRKVWLETDKEEKSSSEYLG